MKPILTLLLYLTAFATAEVTVTQVFGPETKTGPYKHPSCFTELDNGDLYLAFYGGGGEYAESTRVFGSRLVAGSSKWTEPQVIAGNPFKSLGNPVVWQAPDGIVWLFYVTRFGETWSTSRIKAKISRDGAKTWSDSFLVTLQEGTMVRNQPIVLSDGDYLLPIYHETGADTEFTGSDSTSRVLRFTPGQTAWREVGIIHSDKGNIQPGIVEISPGYLLAYCRRCGDYEPTDQGWAVTASSTDGGKTWTKGKDSTFKNPNAALDFKKLANGHLLMVYNDHMYERSPLTVAISEDQGKTFPHRLNVMEGKGAFSYPTAIQTKDGKIHLLFTSDGRTVIQHAVFDEADVLKL